MVVCASALLAFACGKKDDKSEAPAPTAVPAPAPEKSPLPFPLPFPKPQPAPAPAPAPDPGQASDEAHRAIDILNQWRQDRGLTTVAFDEGLSARSLAWAQTMATSGFRHDPSVAGTQERENIAWSSNGITAMQAMQMWNNSPGHAAAMYDRSNWPTAVKAGYGQYNGYAALRLCSQNHETNVCN